MNRPPIIDPNTLTPMGPWTAGLAIYPDGQEILWLLAPDDTGLPGCCCPTCAPHDQLPEPPFVPRDRRHKQAS